MFRFGLILLFITTLTSCGKKFKIDGMTSVSSLDGKCYLLRFCLAISLSVLIRQK